LVVSTYPSEKYELLVSWDDDISNIYIYGKIYLKKQTTNQMVMLYPD
jgi:hypothetical protein